MPETWVYVAGGVISGILIFAIAYNLIAGYVKFNEKQNDLKGFSSLVNDAKLVCYSGRNLLIKDYTFSTNLRILYTSDKIHCSSANDCRHDEECINNFCILVKPAEKIINKESSFGKNLCMQFKDEEELRCEKLLCNVTMQHIGTLPETEDIWAAVNRILGRNYRNFKLNITKFSPDSINITLVE